MSIYNECKIVIGELIEKSNLNKGSILVVGCSTSEVCGSKIGTNSNTDVAEELYNGIIDAVKDKGIYVAIQCCEHLNRAIVIEQEALPNA